MAPHPTGLFLPTNNIWDVLPEDASSVTLDSFKELLVRLYQNNNDVSYTVNLKDSGYYPLTEFVNGQSFFPDPALVGSLTQVSTYRQVFRIVVNFGALPNNATKSVAHGLNVTNAWSWTRIYATASNQTALTGIPIPSANLDIFVDSTNVNITAVGNYSAYHVCYVVLEYLKQ